MEYSLALYFKFIIFVKAKEVYKQKVPGTEIIHKRNLMTSALLSWLVHFFFTAS